MKVTHNEILEQTVPNYQESGDKAGLSNMQELASLQTESVQVFKQEIKKAKLTMGSEILTTKKNNARFLIQDAQLPAQLTSLVSWPLTVGRRISGNEKIQKFQSWLLKINCCPSSNRVYKDDWIYWDETLAQTIYFQRAVAAVFPAKVVNGVIDQSYIDLLAFMLENKTTLSAGGDIIDEAGKAVSIQPDGAGFKIVNAAPESLPTNPNKDQERINEHIKTVSFQWPTLYTIGTDEKLDLTFIDSAPIWASYMVQVWNSPFRALSIGEKIEDSLVGLSAWEYKITVKAEYKGKTISHEFPPFTLKQLGEGTVPTMRTSFTDKWKTLYFNVVNIPPYNSKWNQETGWFVLMWLPEWTPRTLSKQADGGTRTLTYVEDAALAGVSRTAQNSWKATFEATPQPRTPEAPDVVLVMNAIDDSLQSILTKVNTHTSTMLIAWPTPGTYILRYQSGEYLLKVNGNYFEIQTAAWDNVLKQTEPTKYLLWSHNSGFEAEVIDGKLSIKTWSPEKNKSALTTLKDMLTTIDASFALKTPEVNNGNILYQRSAADDMKSATCEEILVWTNKVWRLYTFSPGMKMMFMTENQSPANFPTNDQPDLPTIENNLLATAPSRTMQFMIAWPTYEPDVRTESDWRICRNQRVTWLALDGGKPVWQHHDRWHYEKSRAGSAIVVISGRQLYITSQKEITEHTWPAVAGITYTDWENFVDQLKTKQADVFSAVSLKRPWVPLNVDEKLYKYPNGRYLVQLKDGSYGLLCIDDNLQGSWATAQYVFKSIIEDDRYARVVHLDTYDSMSNYSVKGADWTWQHKTLAPATTAKTNVLIGYSD